MVTTTSLNNQITVFPNPFTDALNIRYRIENPGVIEITLYDLQGKLITTLVRSYKETGQYTLIWDGSNLPRGTYLLRTRFKQQIISQNLVVRQ